MTKKTKGMTKNSIVINHYPQDVIDKLNNVENWVDLFDGYKEIKILNKTDNKIKFRITTKKDEKGIEKTWISERVMENEGKLVKAKRLDNLFPFIYMKLLWTYEILPLNVGVFMTWEQEFELDNDCVYTVQEMESYITHRTIKELYSIRRKIENI